MSDRSFPLILALDLARVTGWAIGMHGERPISDCVELPSQAANGIGAMGAALTDELQALYDEYRFDRIVVEAPLVTSAGQDRTRQALGLAGVLGLWAFRRSIQCREVAAGTVRKEVLGKGTFKKGMAKAAVEAWALSQGYKTFDNNEADALAVLHYAISYAGGGKGF